MELGGGRNYIPLGQAGKSPSGEDNTISDGENSEVNSGRPQLRVVIPGQKGFVPRTVSIFNLSNWFVLLFYHASYHRLHLLLLT